MHLWNPCTWQDFPIFINARDRLGVMKKLIDWLLDAGYRNLIILDNDSTYPPLLTYYSELEKDSRIKIIRLGKNLGHKSLWQSGVLENLKISTPYVYTDPDVVPDKNCPKDFVKRLFEVLQSHHEIRKVAPALVWEDIMKKIYLHVPISATISAFPTSIQLLLCTLTQEIIRSGHQSEL